MHCLREVAGRGRRFLPILWGEEGRFFGEVGDRRVYPKQSRAQVSSRLTDQKSLVREIADQAEDVVWKRLKHYGLLSGLLVTLILGFLAFVGVKTLDDVSKRIEPVVSDAEHRAQMARRTIEETATRVDSVKASLDQLSREAEAQTRRVADRGGEISRKLESLDAAFSEAQKRVEKYQARSEDLSRRLEAAGKALESKVEQISKQVDDVSIRRAYPTLGQQLFVTYDGARWKGAAEKGPKERWLSIRIDPRAVGDFSQDQIEKLVTELKKSGYTPWLGIFGVGGPYSSGYGSLGESNESAVFYFKKDLGQMASDVSAIVSRTLSAKALKPRLADPAALAKDDVRRFVIENSGLDLESFYIVCRDSLMSAGPSEALVSHTYEAR